MLNKAEEEMPSMSDVANSNEIELQEIVENALRSIENLIVQLAGEPPRIYPYMNFQAWTNSSEVIEVH